MKKIPELLAPASGWQQLKAAINNGADAVYIGGALFNARMKADNFKGEDVKRAIDYAHERKIRVYVTLNTLIRDSELPKAFAYANDLYGFGADGLIVQDMGIARLIHRYLPEMHLHLSTQGTVYNPWAVDLVQDLGFNRIVPARELSLSEIKALTKACHDRQMEVEVFVHGALCVCYSGQCQMSRMQGGRSGNRGLCAQPCRLEYREDSGDKGYLLSPKDLCLIEEIPALCEAGVDSLKIEGRLKSPEYVAVVTRLYRKYLDRYRDGYKEETSAFAVAQSDQKALKQIFNRGGFTKGYLYENPEDRLLSGSSPKNQGLYAGRVTGIRNASRTKTSRKLIEVDTRGAEADPIRMGDGLELPDTGNIVTYLDSISEDYVRVGDFKGPIHIGDEVRKVTDGTQMEKAAASFAADDKIKRDEIRMVFTAAEGSRPTLELWDSGRPEGRNGAADICISGDEILEHAEKRPPDSDRIRRQLQKLGGTPLSAEHIEIRIDGEPLIPISVINQMRREGVQNLLLERQRIDRRKLSSEELRKIAAAEKLRDPAGKEPASSEEQGQLPDWPVAPGAFAKERRRLVPLEWFMDRESERNDAVPYILNISKGNLDAYIETRYDEIVEAVKESGILIGNLGWIRRFQESGVKVYGDYGLNVFNCQAAKAFAENGVDVIALSDECSEDGNHVLCRGAHKLKREPNIMNRVPLMITEHPLQTKGLIDRKGVRHKVLRWYSGDKYLLF